MRAGETEAARVEQRRGWPVRVYRRGAEPTENLASTTSAAERLAMMWPLALDAWALAGIVVPDYSRAETPVSVRPLDRKNVTDPA